jgi:hypothetical protein
MIHLELHPEVESRLAAEAEARGLALDRYIETIVSARPAEQRADQPRTPERQREIEGAVDRILKLREGNHLNGLKIKDLIDEGRKY